MSNPISIYLADDHQIILDGLKLLIANESDLNLVGYAKDGETAYRDILQLQPDIAILDLRMPGLTGLELLMKMQKENCTTKFIILTMHDDKRMVTDAAAYGASGYLLKDTGRENLLFCIYKVMKGQTHFPTRNMSSVIEKPTVFTPREKDILRMILDELTNQEIAQQLQLSILTVETHRKNIMHKTNNKSVVGLVKWVIDNGIK